MKRRFKVHPGVLADLADARNYYREIDPALAARFFLSYANSLQHIRKNPLVPREYVPGWRRVVLVPFPYVVAFSVDDKSIDVTALLHARRDPQSNRAVLEQRS
ncbi:MAG: type II toxin-antitoxin system RelE/ParE family toxin [Micrococcales bacterium]|nr:type II toxin-antitoxin system RelE/ParE family toxin [Micrococcales bacterium]